MRVCVCEGVIERDERTFQVTVNDPVLVEIHDTIDDLSSVVRNDALLKLTEIVQDLIETPSRHPLYEDIDMAFGLSGPQTPHYVRVRESPQHHDLLVESLHFSLLLRLGVPGIAHLRGGGGWSGF